MEVAGRPVIDLADADGLQVAISLDLVEGDLVFIAAALLMLQEAFLELPVVASV